MITIRVSFQGLINHHGPHQNLKTYSTLIKAGGHQADVTWPGGSTILTGNEVLRFDPELGAGADSSDADFQSDVPRLSLLTFKTNGSTPGQHPTVGKDHTKARGYFRHRGGRLLVASWFPDLGVYCDNGTTIWGPQCVADVIELTIDFPNNIARLIDGRIDTDIDGPLKNEHVLATFTQNTTIMVTNNPSGHQHPSDGPIPCGSPTYGHHWKLHKDVTDADRIAGIGKTGHCAKHVDDSPKTLSDDSTIMSTGLIAGEIECSNSAYP